MGGLEAGGAEASLLHRCPNSPRGPCGCPEWPQPRPTSQSAQSRSENLQAGKMRKQSILIFKGRSCKVLASLCYKVTPSAFGSAELGCRAENNFRQAQGDPALHLPVRPSQELPQGWKAQGHVSGSAERCCTSPQHSDPTPSRPQVFPLVSVSPSFLLAPAPPHSWGMVPDTAQPSVLAVVSTVGRHRNLCANLHGATWCGCVLAVSHAEFLSALLPKPTTGHCVPDTARVPVSLLLSWTAPRLS